MYVLSCAVLTNFLRKPASLAPQYKERLMKQERKKESKKKEERSREGKKRGRRPRSSPSPPPAAAAAAAAVPRYLGVTRCCLASAGVRRLRTIKREREKEGK
mmetsp:Transcript_14455/g.27980  ORF Transcript_14455/g.27980 Transcript_14455/m.27980 type:complete len:102 (+) Transcript_14455:2179-2484(+)